ncbi:MAG: endopeptidase La [Candidatus Levybacteria bacterium]|nr:endopeptidase La [Candidatus Levybacteria bacterium]
MVKVVPIIPIRDGIIFPNTDSVLTFGRPKSLAALELSFSQERIVCFVLQKSARVNDPSPADIYRIGTLCRIERMIKTEGEINAQVRGVSRVEIKSFHENENFLIGHVEELKEESVDTPEVKALCNHLANEFRRAMNLGKTADFLVFMNIMSPDNPAGQLADLIASVLDLKPSQKQELLELTNVKARLERVAELLAKEIKVLELERKIASKTAERFEKGAREVMLRERLKTIEKELGESDEDNEIRELMQKIKESGMPEEIEEKARKEAKKLAQMAQFNPEAGYIRNYLDWLIDLPWSKESKTDLEVRKAEKMLNDDHFGLKDAKERIVEYLAVQKLAGKMKGPILCFVGPPGVGKTSIGKSIAHALGRKFVKVSLGGIRDEAEIRGHRRTYVGALPGRIIQGIKDAGTKNPVFMLDEIDKVGADFRGDPSSALLEALDPEQNGAFSDHYLEVPFDLSNVMFITTANVLYTIPPALRDRLEVINFAGYTHDEKFHIAKDFLIKKQMEAHGLSEKEIELTDGGLKFIIEHYTRESGVRNLERQIASLLRKIAKLVAEGKKKKVIITSKNVPKFLGPIKMHSTLIEKKDEIGMSTGLAWTEAGGDILFIEVALMPGKGTILMTGQLGDIMKESCQAAMSYIRARGISLGLSPKFFQKIDVHVHVPEGAVPKDGPSAGDAITTAIVSALTKIPVKRTVGMTGEVTLRGRVLEIGGVKEKVIAAHRAGLKTIILPKDNKKDLIDVPKEVIRDLDFKFVTHMDEVLDIALAKPLRVEKQQVSQRPVLHAPPPTQAD